VLVLTRRKNQSIVIGDDIVVTVLEVKGDQIRLGITAPRNVQVYREELLAALKDANTSAVLGDGAAPMAPPAPPPSVASLSLRSGLRAGLSAARRRAA
jgi:carbon storage regulator